MLDSIRFYALAVLLSSSLLGVALAQPAWLEALGFEMAPASSNSLESCSTIVGVADPVCAVTLQRCQAKRQLIARLLKGELSLFETAAWFRDLNAEPENHPDRGYLILAGDSVEEKLCRQVILWAANNKAEKAPASEVELFVARLEAELAAQLCQHGRIVLPEHQ